MQAEGVPSSAAAPDVVHRLASDTYFDHGLLSVKFKALSGRVVFFRPFVQRKTSTGRYVDRVIFIVGDKGELIIADVDASPKRAVILSAVTSILVDGSTVALLFEKSTVEHDVQLMFCPAPSLPGSKSSTPAAQSTAAADEPAAGPDTIAPTATNSRVLFADGASVHSPAAINTPSNPSHEQVNDGLTGVVVPLMTLKHFVQCVRFFAPEAQVILGASADVDMNLKKPKHFSAPAEAIGGGVNIQAADTALPDEISTSQRQPLFQVVSIPARGDDDGTSDFIGGGNGTGKKSFKEVYNASHGIVAAGAEDEQLELARDFGVPVASDAATGERRSLRDIAAQGTYQRVPRGGEETVDHDDTQQQDVIPYLQDADDTYQVEDGEEVGPSYQQYDNDTHFDPHPDASNIAEMSNYAPVSSSYDGVSPLPTNPGALPYSHRSLLGSDSGYLPMASLDSNLADATTDEPLLSDMVRKLRARRGEIQMQNLMIQGEINGMQKNVTAIESSHQVDNDPEFAYHSIYETRRSHRPRAISFVTDGHLDDEQDDDQDAPAARVMVCSKDYNRGINLALVVLNICRRQRQIHLHAERDARLMRQFTDRKYGCGKYYDGAMYVSSGALGLLQRGGPSGSQSQMNMQQLSMMTN